MLSKRDITNLKEIFATKSELAEMMEYCTQTFVTKVEFVAAFDALMHELKAIREDLAAGLYRSREQSDQLENHEIRLTSLEEASPNIPR